MNAPTILNKSLLQELGDAGFNDALDQRPSQTQSHSADTYSHGTEKEDWNPFVGLPNLDLAQERLLLAVEASDLAFYDVDVMAQKVFLNKRWAVIMEQEPIAFNTTLMELFEQVHPDEQMLIQDAYYDAITGRKPHYKIEHRIRTAKGNWRWILSHCKVIERDRHGQALRMAGTVIDIHDRKLAELRAEFLAQHDELTGLSNRVSFNTSIEHAILQAKRRDSNLSVMFIDLDRFKNINDSLGHDVGDKLLQEVARRLRAALRESDIVARLGGDEFVVLIEGWYENNDLMAIGEKILQAVSKPVLLDGQEYELTASVGISTYPQHGANAQDLLRHADVAMYRAKDMGKNNFQFYAELMDFNSVDHLRMESALRRALARNEFRLYYQPIINLATGYLVGMEALVRWQHPVDGLLPPGDFISVAEESGLIVPIGEWVLRNACAQNRFWQQKGYGPLRVSVNLSPRQFQPNLVDIVTRVLEETGLPAQLLELEITEGMVMQNPDQAVRLLNELRDMGISLSIDDFGTGYSSLTYLKRFPIDSLKIDRSFIAELPVDGDSAAIVRAIIQLAHSLDINVVGEGVETLQQADFLNDYSCDRVQGFHYSKPMAPNDFQALINSFPLPVDRLLQPATEPIISKYRVSY